MPNDSEQEAIAVSVQALGKLAESYGPFAFSFVVFFAMWSYIVAPEMERRNVQWDAHVDVLSSQEELVSAERELSITQSMTARSMESTANVLQSTAEALQVVVTRLEAMEHGTPNE